MPMRWLILFALVIGSTVFLTGAWNRSLPSSPQGASVAFIPQAISLDDSIVGSGVDAAQLLAKAVEKLKPETTPWLRTKIRHTVTASKAPFVAEGVLQRGPEHSARLELEVSKGESRSMLMVVSDGAAVVQVRTMPGTAADVSLSNFTEDDDDASKEACLIAKSCGGPGALLRQLQQHLRNATLQTGMLNDVPVIRIHGEIDSATVPGASATTISAQQVRVYLDATTLWPCRLEWWGTDKQGAARAIASMEFMEPELNRELPSAECERLFSYRPAAE